MQRLWGFGSLVSLYAWCSKLICKVEYSYVNLTAVYTFSYEVVTYIVMVLEEETKLPNWETQNGIYSSWEFAFFLLRQELISSKTAKFYQKCRNSVFWKPCWILKNFIVKACSWYIIGTRDGLTVLAEEIDNFKWMGWELGWCVWWNAVLLFWMYPENFI